MAEAKDKPQQEELTAIQRQWIHKSLQTQKDALTRSRQRELAGSEIHRLRGQEIEQLAQLINRFA